MDNEKWDYFRLASGFFYMFVGQSIFIFGWHHDVGWMVIVNNEYWPFWPFFKIQHVV